MMIKHVAEWQDGDMHLQVLLEDGVLTLKVQPEDQPTSFNLGAWSMKGDVTW